VERNNWYSASAERTTCGVCEMKKKLTESEEFEKKFRRLLNRDRVFVRKCGEDYFKSDEK
jgi:hypothetical protein